MMRNSAHVILSALLAANAPASAYAQGSTTSALSGVVVDSAGGVVPGATVVVKDESTGTAFETVSNAEGAFLVPALNPGTYAVTVSLSGFNTAVNW